MGHAQLQLTMNGYGPLDSSTPYASVPYSYLDHPALFVEAPLEDTKFDVHRSISSDDSFHPLPHHLSEPSLSLISSGSGPSLPSASSSTVGSPHSGHSHPISASEPWATAGSFGVHPAIVNHDGLVSSFGTVDLDHEFAFAATGKYPDNYVGECADLSSLSKRSSTFPIHDSSKRLGIPSFGPLSTSPELLSSTHVPQPRASIVPTESAAGTTSSHSLSPIVKQERRSSATSEGVFKSPTTPASARARTPSITSPAARAAHSLSGLSASTATSPGVHGPATPPMQQHAGQFQNHFFAQSSGNFMPPLESSCSFFSFPSGFSLAFPFSLFSLHSLFPARLISNSLSFLSSGLTFGNLDPSLIQGPPPSFSESRPGGPEATCYPAPLPFAQNISASGSPATSPQIYHPYPVSQYPAAYGGYPQPHPTERRPSISSYHSGMSHRSPMSSEFDDDSREKGRCPYAECGRVVKDLKAHMLTHQSERPEKCPIQHCEYNQKGFARKYDKNRHTLTHYKGTMVCGFCPGSGSAAEKSFNRADVFKRHLTSVHGVEQNPPNSRKKSPGNANQKKLSSYCQDATGKCSTCSATFTNAQDFYEHLDDCVLRVVQQEEDSEAVNALQLGRMTADADVQETLERHMLHPNPETSIMPVSEDLDDDDEDDEDDDDDDDEEDGSTNDRSGRGGIRATKVGHPTRPVLSGAISKSKGPAKKGLTHSKGGVALVGRGRKKRQHYPPSWGMAADKMKMKKRVLCVYDGQRRLWKDDLMMHNEFEVRMKLADGKSYVTDLDVETLKRSEALHNATEEEKGPWNADDGMPLDLEELMSIKQDDDDEDEYDMDGQRRI